MPTAKIREKTHSEQDGGRSRTQSMHWKDGQEKQATFERNRSALLGYKRVFRTIGVFSMLINLLMLVPSIYMLQVYDRVLPSRNGVTLAMLTLMMLLMYGLSSALEYVRSFVVIRVGAKLDMHLNSRVYTAAFETNLKQQGVNAGQSLNDLTTIRQFVTGNALFAFFDAPWFPIYLLVIFVFNVWLGLFATIGSAVLVALAIINERVSKRPLAEAQALSMRSTALATSNLRNAEVIEAMGMLPDLMARWSVLNSGFLARQAEASEKAALVGNVTKFVRLTLQSLVLGLGALLAIDGKVSPGMMIAGSILMGRVLGPLELVISVWRQWSGAKSAYERLVDLLDNNPARRIGMSLPAPAGRLTVEAVSAAAPGGRVAVLQGLSFAHRHRRRGRGDRAERIRQVDTGTCDGRRMAGRGRHRTTRRRGHPPMGQGAARTAYGLPAARGRAVRRLDRREYRPLRPDRVGQGD